MAMTPVPHPSFAGLRQIDWDDTASILRHAQPIFEAFATEPDLLGALLTALGTDEHLQVMCEAYDFMDKLVLHDEADICVRVRLHRYRPGYFDRPHNHRWSFASHILRGSYRHRIFGRDDQLREDTDPDALIAIHERVERVGASYALHHTSVHTVQAEADSISILVRGPAAKERFLILDRARGAFWVYGAAQESPQTRASKQMSRAHLDDVIGQVRSLARTQPTGV